MHRIGLGGTLFGSHCTIACPGFEPALIEGSVFYLMQYSSQALDDLSQHGRYHFLLAALVFNVCVCIFYRVEGRGWNWWMVGGGGRKMGYRRS